MSGADIPYQLRPNKFIDRQIFVEMLSRLIMPRGPEKYVYISMGGRHLVDHYAIYNRLGIQAQFSFDLDRNEVARQKFNRPTGATICEEMNSAALPTALDAILQKFPTKQNLIVWLDYTNTDRLSQLQEAVQTLVRLKHGDVFRITLNAHSQTLGTGDQWKGTGAQNPAEYRANRLREQVADLLPTNIVSIQEDELPSVLVKCVELAAQKAEALKVGLNVQPSLITTYRDGQRMLTVTCAISEDDATGQFPSSSFSRWKFACDGWDDLQVISVPILSPKEQYRLDALLHRGPKKTLAGLKFLPADDETASLVAIRSYKSFQRYYPSFRHVED